MMSLIRSLVIAPLLAMVWGATAIAADKALSPATEEKLKAAIEHFSKTFA
jgi:hypothetical protein